MVSVIVSSGRREKNSSGILEHCFQFVLTILIQNHRALDLEETLEVILAPVLAGSSGAAREGGMCWFG